jgi:hypothetical protein
MASGTASGVTLPAATAATAPTVATATATAHDEGGEHSWDAPFASFDEEEELAQSEHEREADEHGPAAANE